MAVGTRSVHDFCWINMLSPEPARAKDFFATVLGWSFGEIPGMGYSIKVDGKDIGGLFDAKNRDGSPHAPIIGVMVKVESADATGEKVKSLGGTAQPSFDVGPQGRMTVCHDPAGANLDMWQPKASAGMDADPTAHGAPSWFECMTTDMDTNAKFYSDLLGWQRELMPGSPMRYMTFKHKGAPVAGMMEITPDMQGQQPVWGTYFTVKDCDETVKLATSVGAVMCVPAMDIAGVGRFAGLTSPQGVVFYVITYNPQTRG